MSTNLWRRVAVLAAAVLTVTGESTGCARTVRGTGAIADGAVFTTPTPNQADGSDQAGSGSAQDLIDRTNNSIDTLVGGMSLTGTLRSDGTVFRIDSQAGTLAGTQTRAGTATVHVNGLTLRVIQLDGTAWLQAPDSFWRAVVADGTTPPPANAWVVAHDLQSFPVSYANLPWVEALAEPHYGSDLQLGAVTTYHGRTATLVTDSDGWTYDVVSDDPQLVVAHVENAAESYDLSYHTAADLQVVAPDPATVVSVAGF